jgi:hypothetical protein
MVIVSSPTETTGLAASNATTSIQELVGGKQSGGTPSSYNNSMAAEAWEQFNKIQSDLAQNNTTPDRDTSRAVRQNLSPMINLKNTK